MASGKSRITPAFPFEASMRIIYRVSTVSHRVTVAKGKCVIAARTVTQGEYWRTLEWRSWMSLAPCELAVSSAVAGAKVTGHCPRRQLCVLESVYAHLCVTASTSSYSLAVNSWESDAASITAHPLFLHVSVLCISSSSPISCGIKLSLTSGLHRLIMTYSAPFHRQKYFCVWKTRQERCR